MDLAGNIYVTGYVNGPSDTGDIATIMYDSDGIELWVAIYNGPGNGHDKGSAIVLDSCANVYVAGTSTGSGTLVDLVAIKYSHDFIVTGCQDEDEDEDDDEEDEDEESMPVMKKSPVGMKSL